MRCAMRGLILALVAIFLGCLHVSAADASEPKKPETFLSMSNLDTQGPDAEYRVGHTIRLVVTKIKKKDEISLCHRIVRPVEPRVPETKCTQDLPNSMLHRNGLWSFDFKLRVGDAGDWETWVMVNRFESNKLSFRVQP